MVKRFLTHLLVLSIAAHGVDITWARTDFEGKKIETWADDYFGTALANKRINGASVGFVQDGSILFLKAYGWEDQKARIPLDPRQTRFRMCSTSKTVTATALMQLLERGQIASLDDPVNAYLTRYKLPPPYGDEVTFRQLMTHSAGMAGHGNPQGTKRELAVPVDAKTVKALFRENIVRKPGMIGAYANLGVALEGVAIEDVTGQSLAAYVDANIFKPLGMQSALFHHSLEKPPHLAQPYAVYPDGALQEVRFYPKHPLTAASGGLITTTEDMLKYVALHADEEAQAFSEILSSEGRKTMHARHFGRHPADLGIGLHFYRDIYGEERMVSHSCGLPGTGSMMGVFPDSNAGFVVTVLSTAPSPTVVDLIGKLFGTGHLVKTDAGPKGDGASPDGLTKALLGEKMLPPIAPIDPPADMAQAHHELAGTYWRERRSFTSFAKLAAVGTKQVALGAQDGELLIDGWVYLRTAPGVYDAEARVRRVFFRQPEPNGDIFLHDRVSFSYRQVKGLNNPKLAHAGLALSLGLSLTGLFALAWGRRQGLEGFARRTSVGLGICVILLSVLIFAGYERAADIATIDFSNGDLTRITLVIALLNVYFLLGVGLVGSAIVAWGRGLFGDGFAAVAIKLHLTILALAAIAAWPGMVLFNLIGLQY